MTYFVSFRTKSPNIQMHKVNGLFIACIASHLSFSTPRVFSTIYSTSFIFPEIKLKFLLMVFFTTRVSMSIRVLNLM